MRSLKNENSTKDIYGNKRELDVTIFEKKILNINDFDSKKQKQNF